jgi:hypothetical protein
MPPFLIEAVNATLVLLSQLRYLLYALFRLFGFSDSFFLASFLAKSALHHRFLKGAVFLAVYEWFITIRAFGVNLAGCFAFLLFPAHHFLG